MNNNIEKKLSELRIKYSQCEDPVIREIIKRQAIALKYSQETPPQYKLI